MPAVLVSWNWSSSSATISKNGGWFIDLVRDTIMLTLSPAIKTIRLFRPTIA